MDSDVNFESKDSITDINITPFVDVMLVLLVIFMVTAPLMMKDVLGLNLPKTASHDQQLFSTLGIAITKNGQILLNGQLISEEILRSRAEEAVNKQSQTQVIISADVDARHGDVVKVIDIVKSVGIENFAIQIERN